MTEPAGLAAAGGHSYQLVTIIGRRARFRASCTCGWSSERIFDNAGMAGSDYDQHQERQAPHG